MSAPTFSVILCTYNRSNMLDEVLKSLDRMEYPKQACEIIVVDNASIDNTRSVVERWQEHGRFPMRYVYEERQGLSRARNTGVQASHNDLVAFIDDDTEVDPGWLAALADVFENNHHVVCVGGRIELLWDAPRPPWLAEDLESYLGRNSNLGDEVRELPEDLYPFGGNMAVKRPALEEIGGFDTNLGRIGTYLGANEELRVIDQLRNVGRIAYTPDALVFHRVPSWRTTREYFIKRGYFQGVANANLTQLTHRRSRSSLIRSSAADCARLGGDFLAITGSLMRGLHTQAYSKLVFTITRLGQINQNIYLFMHQSEP